MRSRCSKNKFALLRAVLCFGMLVGVPAWASTMLFLKISKKLRMIFIIFFHRLDSDRQAVELVQGCVPSARN